MVTYAKAVDQLDAFLAAPRRGRPRRVADIRREDIEAFLVERSEAGMRPAMLSQRFRSLQQYFKWLAVEGEIERSPMATMRPPQVPETPPPVLREEDLRRLLDTCAGTSFEDRRDAAILRLFHDTGMRRGELAGLRVDDVDFDHEVALVLGKGRRPRACPFGHKTGQALDRYLRVRSRRADAHEPWLWLGKRGRLTETGVEQVVKRRGRQAGLPEPPPPPVPAHLRPPVAVGRRHRGRVDAPGRLEEPPDAGPLRRLDGRRACPRGVPTAQSRRSALMRPKIWATASCVNSCEYVPRTVWRQ